MVVKTKVAKHSCWTLSREFSSLVVCFQSECSWTCALAIDRDLESRRALREWLKITVESRVVIDPKIG